MASYCDTPLLVICEVQVLLLAQPCRAHRTVHCPRMVNFLPGSDCSRCDVCAAKGSGATDDSVLCEDGSEGGMRSFNLPSCHPCGPLLMRVSSQSDMAVQDGTQKSQKVFVNVPTEVGATEAEEIGE